MINFGFKDVGAAVVGGMESNFGIAAGPCRIDSARTVQKTPLQTVLLLLHVVIAWPFLSCSLQTTA
jgi:hypothetical protein